MYGFVFNKFARQSVVVFWLNYVLYCVNFMCFLKSRSFKDK